MKITFDTGTPGVGGFGGPSQALGANFGFNPAGGSQSTDNLMTQMLMMMLMNMIQANQNGQNGQLPFQAAAAPINFGGLDGSQFNADPSNPMNAIMGLVQQVGKLLEALAPLMQNAGNSMGSALAMSLGKALEGAMGNASV